MKPMPHKTRLITLAVAVATVTAAATTLQSRNQQTRGGPATTKGLVARQNAQAGTIIVTRAGSTAAVVTQNAPPDARPFLHPIAAPDGRGVLTESSPTHHPHQTGLYWGFTRLNGRDYFHNRGADYWRRVSATVLQASGDEVRWQTVYDLIDENGAAILTETERWSMREQNGRFLLDLTWRGEARRDVTIGKYDYGGLFLRMPWRQGIDGEVVNAARQRNARAEGQRAMWVDVAMRVEGRDDRAHIAIFDHPDNGGYPQPWRVDDQLGVGTARARAADWSIPANQTEVIRHRFVVYTGTLDDVEMTNAWTEYSGNRSTYSTAALWGIAQQEGRAATFLSPQEAAANMTTVAGYKVNAWAGEPMVTQPMAFCWDDRGRLWVAENRDYETRAQGFSNAGDSRIVILEDTDRDGVADSRKVFLEGIPFPAAIAVGFDGLFLGAPPNLLFVPDRNGDDKADMADIEVRLTGWGISDRHETINSLHWGPDGWLYGLQGYATTSKVRKPEGKGRLYAAKEPFPSDLLQGPGVEINGGVWRYHPTKDRFEVVAHGFSNPWGIDYDAKGQLVISACVIPHLWHVIPGGIYHRQGGQHFNPYVYSDIQTIADHRHRSAHGGARIYQSDAFPASQAGRVFMANIHEHAVLSDVLERKGSGFTAHHGEDFVLANNAQWIGFSVEIGPDGNLYVLDWHDGDICGQGITHKETGRIFRIAPAQSLAKDWDGRYGDLKALSDAELVQLQTSASDWHARRARVILQARASSGKLSPAVRAAAARAVHQGRQPGLAAARDVDAARHGVVDARHADPDLRRLGRIHPCVGGAAHHGRRHAVAAGARHLPAPRPRGPLAGRAPLSRIGAPADRRRPAVADRERAHGARRGCRRSQPAEDPVARRRTARARQSGTRARARRPQQHPDAGAVHRPPRRRCRQRRCRRGRDRQDAKVGDRVARGTARRAAGTRGRDGAGGAGPLSRHACNAPAAAPRRSPPRSRSSSATPRPSGAISRRSETSAPRPTTASARCRSSPASAGRSSSMSCRRCSAARRSGWTPSAPWRPSTTSAWAGC